MTRASVRTRLVAVRFAGLWLAMSMPVMAQATSGAINVADRKQVAAIVSGMEKAWNAHDMQTAAAEIKVWTARALATVLAEVGPQFERATGHKLAITTDISFVKRATAGEPFDLMITGRRRSMG